MLEENDALQDSSLADAIEETIPDSSTGDVTPDSSQEAIAETPADQTEPKEPPFNEHPRWKEVQEEKRIAQARADRLEQQLLEISGKLATPKEQGTDPYADMPDEDKKFWKEVDRRAKEQARVIAQEERKVYMKEHQSTRQQLAVMAYKEFQAKHPDVIANSPEENAIAQKVGMGYSPDDAYEVVIGSSKRKVLEEEVAKTRKAKQGAKNTQKLAANLETGGVSSGSPIQPTDKMSVAEFVEMQMKQAG